MIKTAAFFLSFCFFSLILTAQNPRKTKITIKSSAECEFCKKNIEKSLKKVKGIRRVECDFIKHEVYFTYNSKKISPEEIRMELNAIGYDADDQKANFDKYKKIKHR